MYYFLFVAYFIKGGLYLLIVSYFILPWFFVALLQQHLLSVSESFHFVCFSASTCKWDHTVFVFFVQLISLPVKPSRSINIIAKHKIAFFVIRNVRCAYTSLVFPFIDQKVLRLLLYVGYCKQCCGNMQIGASNFLPEFLRRTTDSYGSSILTLRSSP